MVVLTARIEPHAEERRELAQALLRWAETAREQAGCVGANVYEDLATPAVFALVAHWENRPALEAHLAQPAFGALLGALDLLAWPPLATVTGSGEFDLRAFVSLRQLRDRGQDR